MKEFRRRSGVFIEMLGLYLHHTPILVASIDVCQYGKFSLTGELMDGEMK